MYHNPALQQTRFEEQPGAAATIAKFEYKPTAVKEEFTMALKAAAAVPVPEALANTGNFRHTDLAEAPEMPAKASKSGRFTPKTFNPESHGAAPPPARQNVSGRRPAHPTRGTPKDRENTASAGVFVPDSPDTKNKTMLFVPDDSLHEQTMPPPPRLGTDTRESTEDRKRRLQNFRLGSQ